jgi:hypothetical protein
MRPHAVRPHASGVSAGGPGWSSSGPCWQLAAAGRALPLPPPPPPPPVPPAPSVLCLCIFVFCALCSSSSCSVLHANKTLTRGCASPFLFLPAPRNSRTPPAAPQQPQQRASRSKKPAEPRAASRKKQEAGRAASREPRAARSKKQEAGRTGCGLRAAAGRACDVHAQGGLS